MSSDQSDEVALQQLQTQHKDLLDDIDKLRSQGLERYVELPQLIVCGDQSSGKSSVLQAISRFRFPVSSVACTRFATELILRRGQSPKITVSIRPGHSRSSSDRHRLQDFQFTFTDTAQFLGLVDEAAKCIGVSQNGDHRYTDDVLRVEISGPDQPHLTLVDLPGFIRNAKDSNDIELVRELVKSYMAKKSSVILAIVDASHDWATQEVLELVKTYDPVGKRTFGIVTKPDKVDDGSELQTSYLKILKNEHTSLDLGWHVVLNRDHARTETSNSDRDLKEKDFLSTGVWKQIERKFKGASALRDRLSKVLLDEIRSKLPSLIQDIRSQTSQCQERLDKLGSERSTPAQQRQYLIKISNEFQRLVLDASNGRYDDSFFSKSNNEHSSAPDWRPKMLRAVIRNLNSEFAQRMIEGGHRRQVLAEPQSAETDTGEETNEEEDEDEAGSDDLDHDEPDTEDNDSEATSNNGKNADNKHGSQSVLTARSPWSGLGWGGTITRAELGEELNTLSKDIRGNEPENFPNPQLVVYLFRDQARRWQQMAEDHLKTIWTATENVLHLLLKHLAIEEVEHLILKHLFGPWLKEKRAAMISLLQLLMKPYKSGQPQTLNPNFLTNINRLHNMQAFQSVTSKLDVDPEVSRHALQFSLSEIENAVLEIGEPVRDASSMIICTTEAFYEVCQTFVALYCY